MSYSFDGVNDRMTGAFTSSYAQPVTLACWVKVTTHPVATQVAAHLGNSDGVTNDAVRLQTSATDDYWQANSITSGGSGSSASATKNVDATWAPWIGTFVSDTNRNVYISDASANDTTSRVVGAALKYLRLGENGGGSVDFAGKLAEFSVWNKELDAGERASYISGTASSGIAAANLIGYYRLNANNATQANEGTDAGGDLTVTGATYDADHPTITEPAPTFDTSPTVTSQTATAYTLAYDASADADTIYTGIYLKDAATPTAAQVKAGTNAHGTATEATTGSSDTIVVTATESPAFPIYGIHSVVENEAGLSAVSSLTDKALDPATGKQHITADVSGGITTESIFYGASPAVATGDIVVIDTHVDSFQEGADAYPLTCSVDGLISVDPGLDTSRLDFDYNVYDVSAGDWMNGSPVTSYINNQAPDFVGSDSTFLYKKDTAITANPREADWADAESDAITVTEQDSLPAGLSFGSEQITGTPTAYGETVVTERGTDAIGDYAEHDITIQVGDELPDVVNVAQATAVSTIEGTASWTTAIVTAYSATIAVGNVISMSPEAATLVPHNQEVTLTVSLGASTATTSPRSGRKNPGRGLLRPGGR